MSTPEPPPGPEWNPSSAGQPATPPTPPPPPPYQPPPGVPPRANPYPWQPTQGPQTSVLAIVSLVLGIIGILGDCFCFLGLPFGIAAVITGALALRETGDRPGAKGGRGLAIAGLATGVLALVLVVAAFVYVFTAGDSHWNYSFN